MSESSSSSGRGVQPARPQGEPITIQGLSPAVVEWLRSADGLEASPLAHRLVELHHWNLILTPPRFEQPVLLLGDPEKGLVIIANRRPTPEEVARDREALREAVPENWLHTSLVSLMDQAPDEALLEALGHKLKKIFSSSTVSACAITIYGCTFEAQRRTRIAVLPGLRQGLRSSPL